MVFERQPPSPEVCICSENVLNNRVLARGPLPPIWCKLAPKRLPKGGLGPLLEAQGRREGHGNEKTEVPKSFRNSFEKRPDFVSGRVCPEATVLNGGVRALGFSNIQPVDDVFV